MSGTVSRTVVDTSILVTYLRGGISTEMWHKTFDGRAPLVSPVTLHELRRGIKPGSRWELDPDSLMPGQLVISPPPSTSDWLEGADIIRRCFAASRSKPELAALAHDVLIALAARAQNAELWSRDKDFKIICQALSVPLLDH